MGHVAVVCVGTNLRVGHVAVVVVVADLQGGTCCSCGRSARWNMLLSFLL